MLVARLSDIKLVGTLEKKRDHFVVMCIDEEVIATSERKYGVGPHRWDEVHRLPFRPSSKMTIQVFRASINPLRFRRPYPIGQHTCNITQLFENNSELELKDDSTGRPTPTRLIITLSTIPDLAKDIMTRVDADLAAAGLDNTTLANASAHIDDATATSRVGSDAVKVLASCVEPLGNALKLFVKVMDSVADAHPIVKASWTILSATYKAVQAQMDQDQEIVSLSETLREMLGVAQIRLDLTVIENTTNVIENICRVSLEVASLIDEYTRHSSVLGRTANSLIKDMKPRISKCQDDCKDLMEKFRTRVLIGIDNKMLEQDISAKLNAPDCFENYDEALKSHHGSTGSWFINGQEFSEWKDSGRLFCIYGKTGCGKTILCSSIITNVVNMCKEKESSACAYFFFDGRTGKDTHQRHDGFIRSLIRQFWDQYEGIPTSLAQYYGKGSRKSPNSLEDVLQQILGGFTDSYIIIDSVDECPETIEGSDRRERRDLLNWIIKVSSSNKGNLHLLVTSRPKKDIKAHLQSLEPASITMDEGLGDNDIKTYINAKMKEGRLNDWPEDVKMRVKDTLTAKAQGMFRWLAMQIKVLQDCFDVAELDDQLVRLPKNLDETYRRILERVPEQRLTRTKIILQWTAFSARAPRLEELGEAVGVEFDQDGFPTYNPRRKYLAQDVLAACEDLLIESNGHVKLAHFSVKEYLISDRIADGTTKSFSMSEKLSHSCIAKTSLAYLLQLDSPGLEDEILAAAPLAEYAARNWVFHVRSGEGDGEWVMKKLIAALLESENPLVNWIRLWDPENPRNGMQPRILSTEVAEPLYYASLLGFTSVSQYLLDSGASVNPQRNGGQRVSESSSYMRYGNALQVASYEGHRGMVKFLLDKDVNINMPGGEYGCALQAAAWTCDEAMVALLLDKDANVNMPGGKYGCALQAAVWMGEEAMVKLLLERGADVNITGGEFGCALQAAACRGNETIVRLLLEPEWNANIDIQGGKYDTALQAAIFNGHDGVRNLLVTKGAAQTSVVDAAPFIEALIRGEYETVKSLLEKGVDVNMSGGVIGSPLHIACLEDHPEIVRLLLANNADVNKQGGLFGNPLQAASFWGHLEIAKILLKNNAEVNAQGGVLGNALMAASLYGHNAIVELLLQHNADANARTILQFSLSRGVDTTTLVRRFHEKEGDRNIDEEISHPLHVASHQGYRNIMETLLAHGADVNLQGGCFGNALRAALDKGHHEAAKLLLEHGATPLPNSQQNNN